MNLDEFFNYKNQLMQDLLTNETIVKLICDNGDVPSDPSELMYTQVFPYEYVPETVTRARTFICCDVDIQYVGNKTFLKPAFELWVFTHKSTLRLPEGGVRTDKLCAEIDKMLNGNRFYGLGQLDLYSVRRFAPIADYQGKSMVYDAAEFNRNNSVARQVPTNRKQGY